MSRARVGLYKGLLVVLILALVGACPKGGTAENSNPFHQADLARLSEGAVVVKVDPSEGIDKRKVRAAVLIDAAAELIWHILLDCDHAPEFVPGLRSCRVLSHEEDADTIEHSVKYSGLLPEVTYRFQARYTRPERIDFTRISGDLRDFEGSWSLQGINEGRKTIVEYSLYIDPGFLVPQWLVRSALRRDLTELMIALRDRVAELSPRPVSSRRSAAGEYALDYRSHAQ